MQTSLLSRYSADYGALVARRSVERRLRAAATEAALANRAKSEFLANVSHELRTPLNAIIGFSDLIRTSKGPADQKKAAEYATLVSQAGRHLLSMINDILDLAKVENRAFKIQPQPSDLKSVVLESVAMLSARTEAKSQSVAADVDPFMPYFSFDQLRIKQVIINLLANASKFSAEGGRISVRARSDGSFALCEVSDNGIGMSAEEVKVALMPFGRVENHRSRNTDGTGLGLPIAKALVEAHGGTLEIVSVPDAGTRVLFSLPLKNSMPLTGKTNA